MKNLLTYISPERAFNAEHQMTAKIQIDNSLSLGWSLGDLLLVTNFPYEYNGVRSLVIGDENYCAFCWPATKIYVIDYLFRAGLIEPELYWYHDFDCFQLNPFTDPVIVNADIGMTNYGRVPRLCSASIFFKSTAADIFAALKAGVDSGRTNEEDVMARLLALDTGNLKERFELLNVTYAINRANIRPNYAAATKPVKAAHFHLTPDKYNQFVLGQTMLRMPLIPDRLVEVFTTHGWIG